jgi:CrcB protein
LRNTIIVLVGSGIGGAIRHLCNVFFTGLIGVSFPWTILGINVFGSTAMGLIVGWYGAHGNGSQDLRLFLTTGIVAGFTTFSTFSLDIVLLAERGNPGLAAAYAAASVGIALLGMLAGMWLMQSGLRWMQ